nr:hypothetical protein [Lachnospiraceae bacterium]
MKEKTILVLVIVVMVAKVFMTQCLVHAEPRENILLDSYYDGIDEKSSSTCGVEQEKSEMLFDNDHQTKFYCSDAPNGTPVRIAWKMKQPVVLREYTITTAEDADMYGYRNPKGWHLFGSNNATTWYQLDTVTDSGLEAKKTTDYTFTTDVQKSYQYFLLQVEDNGGFYGIQIADISLKGDATTQEGNVMSTSEYDILFAGDWDEITNEEYVSELVKLFYNSYPRLYAR